MQRDLLQPRLYRHADQQTGRTVDRQHSISESADKVVITTKVKRGNGTRDEDRLKIKAKGNDGIEAVEELNRALDRIEDSQTLDRLRDAQAGGSDE